MFWFSLHPLWNGVAIFAHSATRSVAPMKEKMQKEMGDGRQEKGKRERMRVDHDDKDKAPHHYRYRCTIRVVLPHHAHVGLKQTLWTNGEQNTRSMCKFFFYKLYIQYITHLIWPYKHNSSLLLVLYSLVQNLGSELTSASVSVHVYCICMWICECDGERKEKSGKEYGKWGEWWLAGSVAHTICLFLFCRSGAGRTWDILAL